MLRPAVLQAPQPKVLSQTVPSSGTNGVSMPADCTGPATSASPENLTQRSPSESAEGTHTFEEKVPQKTPSGVSEETHCEEEQVAPQAFVFGQNLRDRVKVFGLVGVGQWNKNVAWGACDGHIFPDIAWGPHPPKNPWAPFWDSVSCSPSLASNPLHNQG